MAEQIILRALKGIYPYLYGRMINCIILRNKEPLPIKYIRCLYEETYFSRTTDESMSPSPTSGKLSSFHRDMNMSVMRKLT